MNKAHEAVKLREKVISEILSKIGTRENISRSRRVSRLISDTCAKYKTNETNIRMIIYCHSFKKSAHEDLQLF